MERILFREDLKKDFRRSNKELREKYIKIYKTELEKAKKISRIKYKLIKKHKKKLSSIEISEQYNILYKKYTEYTEKIKIKNEKIKFIEEEILYIEQKFGSFKGNNVNAVMSLDLGILIGILTGGSLLLLEAGFDILGIENKSTLAFGTLVLAVLILRNIYNSLVNAREEDLFYGLSIKVLEQIKEQFNCIEELTNIENENIEIYL